MALPAFACHTLLLQSTSHAAIDRYLLPAGPTAANLQQKVCCCGPVLGQTDGQTGGHCIVSYTLLTFYAGKANNRSNYQKQKMEGAGNGERLHNNKKSLQNV